MWLLQKYDLGSFQALGMEAIYSVRTMKSFILVSSQQSYREFRNRKLIAMMATIKF